MLISKWEANFKFEKDMLTSYPIWIKLKKLDLSLWNARVISKLASIVGKLFEMNENTKLVRRLDYARVLVSKLYF